MGLVSDLDQERRSRRSEVLGRSALVLVHGEGRLWLDDLGNVRLSTKTLTDGSNAVAASRSQIVVFFSMRGTRGPYRETRTFKSPDGKSDVSRLVVNLQDALGYGMTTPGRLARQNWRTLVERALCAIGDGNVADFDPEVGLEKPISLEVLPALQILGQAALESGATGDGDMPDCRWWRECLGEARFDSLGSAVEAEVRQGLGRSMHDLPELAAFVSTFATCAREVQGPDRETVRRFVDCLEEYMGEL